MAESAPETPLDTHNVEAKKPGKAWTNVDARVQNALPPEDFKKVADVRRQMWTGGFGGSAAGLCAGIIGFIFTRE